MNNIDTGNHQMVALRGEKIIVLLPKQSMTADEAILHAAWLVALAKMDATHEFEEVLHAVNNT